MDSVHFIAQNVYIVHTKRKIVTMASTLARLQPCLWFDDQAEAAAGFYTGTFPRSRITGVTHYSEVGREIHGRVPGSVMTVSFTLDGEPMLALNGGPLFRFTPAISLMILCDDQSDIDHYWEALGDGADPDSQQCGWLTDRFGVTWQVVPREWEAMMHAPDRAAAQRALQALMGMRKPDLAALRAAFAGR